MTARHSLILSFAGGLLLWGAAAGCARKDAADAAPQAPSTPTGPGNGPYQVAVWETNPAQTARFSQSATGLNFGPAAGQRPAITVDTAQTYQTVDGFGYALTGGSAQLLHQMSAPARAALLQELFGTGAGGIGVSYLRISIGASDLDARVFTYDDPADGQPDPTLAQFSLAPDRVHLIPVLKEILAINPDLKLLGSPWTAPLWMKTNNASVGGSLRAEYYPVYARYFVKYLQAMQAEGIRLDAVTLQNEPLHGGNNPSMLMTAAEQATFVRDHVGPALRAAGLATKIIVYDHNLDRPDYPLAILQDPLASPYVDGSAFHLYAGTISTMSTVRNAFPAKNVYFTEQWVGGPGNFAEDFKWHVDNLIIGAPRNWSRTVLEWNLAADPAYNPHTPGGCPTCLGALTLSGDAVTRNTAYYTVAHASKFARPGSVRVASNLPANLPNVAFRTPSGQKVLLVLNTGPAAQTFDIQFRGKAATARLEAGAAGTYVW